MIWRWFVMRMPLFKHFFSNPLVINLSVHLLGAGNTLDYRHYRDGNLPLTDHTSGAAIG